MYPMDGQRLMKNTKGGEIVAWRRMGGETKDRSAEALSLLCNMPQISTHTLFAR